MKVLNKDEFMNSENLMVRRLRDSIFIYPTDTIYGIGCDATNEELVNTIRIAKNRFDMPFSVIAPSKEWIEKNCAIDETAKSWIEKLPGPYTLILRLKNKDAVAENVNFGSDSLGVRIPNNWFSEVVTKMDVPIITTSANVAGHDFMTSLDDLDPVFREYVDYVIEQGELKGKPSTLIFLNKSKVEVKKR